MIEIMEYKSKHKAEKIDALLDKVEALPEGMMIEVTWADLVALRDAEGLVAGQKYRITDYETFCAWADTQCAGHPFDIIVTALDNKTLDEKASAIWSARDTEGYFADSDLPAWDVRYCLNNDTERFDGASKAGKSITIETGIPAVPTITGTYEGPFEYNGQVVAKWTGQLMGNSIYMLTENENVTIGDMPKVFSTQDGYLMGENWPIVNIVNSKAGKGFIYQLIDEIQNEAPYDFKNIKFIRPLKNGEYNKESGINEYCYTFSLIDPSSYSIADHSVVSPTTCLGNKIGSQSKDNVFLTKLGEYCRFNRLGQGCYDNTFGSNSHKNVLEEECHTNIFGSDCSNNKLGIMCVQVSFELYCRSNILKGVNINISFGESCESNIVGTYCCDIVLGAYCSSILFNEGCSSSKIVVSPEDNSPKSYCENIVFDTSCYSVILWCSESTTVSNKLKNIHVKGGVEGSSENPLYIEISKRGADYVQTVARNSSGEIKVYCEADLVQ